MNNALFSPSATDVTPLSIAGIGIRQDAHGRYCLNDLHKAAGGEKRHQPSDWAGLQQTQDLIAEISNSGDSRSYPIETKEGRHNVPMSPAKFNELLAKHGLLIQAQRPSKGGEFKKFWAVTAQGETYGKNITSPVNQRETQPHWFVDRFANLLTDLGLPVELT